MDRSGLEFFGDVDGAAGFVEASRNGRFLFALVISHTGTCQVPGITAAGADPGLVRLTPAADAEYLHYGSCHIIKGIPATPDGKPTPAILTRTALESSGIQHVIIDAGSAVPPDLPYIHTGLEPGGNILDGPAMTETGLALAMDRGRTVGRTLASMADCLVIGESIPGGTTTALAVLRGMGLDARVSSSMAENPMSIKRRVADAALGRLPSDDPYDIVREAGDPMIAFVAGMLGSAPTASRVMLAGGTQMAAVLALASRIGLDMENTVLGTTSYVLDDPSSDIKGILEQAANVPGIAADPGLARSRFPGLRAYSKGFVKEGAGAGGATIAHMIRTGDCPARFVDMVDAEYGRAFTLP